LYQINYQKAVVPTSIRLDVSVENRLDALARSSGRSKSFLLRQLITNGIEDLEDSYRASVVMERIPTGQEKVYSIEQVRQHLDLET
jgi:RHH-type transcriptional regulator, rel operon repressor / antitoxin RelB